MFCGWLIPYQTAMVAQMNNGCWHPGSWRSFPIQQSVDYPNPEAFAGALRRLRSLPPLVQPEAADALRSHLARAGRGEAFVLQGGDCAEQFSDCTADAIASKLKILLQMSLVLTFGAHVPVVRIGRIAGQYAKPRSSRTERLHGREVLSYRGDLIHSASTDPDDPLARVPDPTRLLDAYFHASATLNYIHALIESGFADLQHPESWELPYAHPGSQAREYHAMVERLLDCLRFMRTTGLTASGDDAALRRVEFFTSHEALHLPFEEALTRTRGVTHYNLGAHMLWIGERTRQLDGAHLEYARGIANPIGVKVGPAMGPEELCRLIEGLNPDSLQGRLTLITRMGAQAIAKALPPLLRAVQARGIPVVWICDPMHGNTQTTQGGIKTRAVNDVLSELKQCFALHRAEGSILAGVHFELTGDDVSECVGGPQEISAEGLQRAYTSVCDPRLNAAQSLELAFLIASELPPPSSSTEKNAS